MAQLYIAGGPIFVNEDRETVASMQPDQWGRLHLTRMGDGSLVYVVRDQLAAIAEDPRVKASYDKPPKEGEN